MLPATVDYQEKIKETTRSIKGKVTIDYTDPFLDQSIEASANEENSFSFPHQTFDAVSNPTRKWASLDGSWLLDGSYYLMPGDDSDHIGWWGNSLSGANGVFTVVQTLTATFFARPIRKLNAVGDSKRGEYPVDFTISLYDQSNAELYKETVVGNTLVSWHKDINAVVQVTKMVLEIQKWSHPGRQVKILEFMTSIQETYEGDDILLINLLEEREISNGSLPIGNISANEIEVRLNNIDRRFDAGNSESPLYGTLKANRRIKAWLGLDLGDSVEWHPLGVFWSGDWNVPENEVWANTTGRDRMDLLRKSTYSISQVKINTTLYQLALDVLKDAGLLPSQYWVDPELQEFTVPYAWFGSLSHREALRRIVEGCMGQAYADRNGVVTIEGPSFLTNKVISQLDITADDYFRKDNPVKWSEIANYIEVETNPLRPDVLQEVYKSNDPISLAAGTSKTFTVFYNESPVIEATASLADANTTTTITSVNFFAWGANITVTNSGSSSDSFSILVNGKPLKVLNKEKAVAYDDESILDNGKLRYQFPENPFVQTLSVAQKIADQLLATFKNPRRDVDLEWRGNPALQLADRITLPDYKDISTADYHITSQTLEFDGGLKSKIIGRRA